MVSQFDKKMGFILVIVLILFGFSVYSYGVRSSGARTFREGETWTIWQTAPAGWEYGRPPTKITKKKQDPSFVRWIYELEISQLKEESIRIDVTYYEKGNVIEKDTGIHTIHEGHTPMNFTHFTIRLDDVNPRRARVIIKPI